VTGGLFFLEDLMAEEFPEQQWVLDDLIPEGVTLLAGKPKIGKSWMALDIALAVASGGTALGRDVGRPRRVLYLALEDTKRRLQARMTTLLGTDPPPVAAFGFAQEWEPFEWRTGDVKGVGDVTVNPGLDLLESVITGNDVEFVVIDTLYRVKATGGQSGYAQDYKSVTDIAGLARRTGVSILLVHHQRKQGSDDSIDTVQGTTGITGAVDTVALISKGPGRADAFLDIRGRDVEAAELALMFDPEACRWSVAGEAEDFRRSTIRNDILRVLGGHPTGLTPTKVAELLDVKANTAKQRLHQMKLKNEVRAEGGRYYAITHNPVTESDDRDGYAVMGYGQCDTEEGEAVYPPPAVEEAGS
jgi:hypothetical protein